MIALALKYRAKPHTIFREIDDRIIALNLSSGQYFTMNEIGTLIWHLLMEEASMTSIADEIRDEFDVPVEQLAEDMKAFLKELKENDLIEEI